MATGRAMWVAAGTAALVMLALAAAAQQGAVGPCSPYRAADGDIPSEMPGCARRLRPAPGSLAEELQFRRSRKGADADEDAAADEEAPTRRRPKRARSAPPP